MGEVLRHLKPLERIPSPPQMIFELNPPQRKGLVSDQIICTPQQASENDNHPMMRRIKFIDDQQQYPLGFLTNSMKLAATPIAEIYKIRWQIDLF